jgi:hypothetical protein
VVAPSRGGSPSRDRCPPRTHHDLDGGRSRASLTHLGPLWQKRGATSWWSVIAVPARPGSPTLRRMSILAYVGMQTACRPLCCPPEVPHRPPRHRGAAPHLLNQRPHPHLLLRRQPHLLRRRPLHRPHPQQRLRLLQRRRSPRQRRAQRSLRLESCHLWLHSRQTVQRTPRLLWRTLYGPGRTRAVANGAW